MGRVVALELDWHSKHQRLQALGVLWELREQWPNDPFEIKMRSKTIPGRMIVAWEVAGVADGDQLQKRVAELLDEIGWMRAGTALTQLGRD